MHPFIPQAIGLLAVATFLLSYQQKKRRGIIICNVVSRCLYIIQYLLLGAISGAVLDILGAIASVIAEKKKHPLIQKHIKAFFLACNIAITVAGITLCLMSKNPLDLLPIAGVLLHTGAFWLTNEKIIRRVSLIGSPFWLVYNFVSRAYGSALGDLLTMCSIVIAMIKFRNRGCEKDERV